MSEPLPEELLLARGQAIDHIRRADSKASMLLTLVTAVVAGVVAVVGQGPRLVWPVVALAVVVLGAAVVFLLAALRPRVPGTDPVPGTWLHAATVDAVTLIGAYDGAVADRDVDEPTGQARALRVAEDTCRLAVLARVKLRRIATAVRLIEAALLVLAVPVLAVVVLR